MAAIEFKASPLNVIIAKLLGRMAKGGMQEALQESMGAVASAALRYVRDFYLNHGEGHTAGTKETYAQGKLAGIWPARSIWSGAHSLMRGTGLIQFLKVDKIDKATIWIGIDHTATYASKSPRDPTDISAGRGSSKAARPVRAKIVAEQMEDPHPVIIQMTRPMQAYLAMLREKRAGKGRSKRAPQLPIPIGKTIMYKPVARKVWEPAFKILPTAHPRFKKELQRQLRRRGWRDYKRSK